ncbi:MAG: hypothetical protein KatS3mg123_0810 [Burkholderiales bacterium]|nr:MAG: hypothetical protein KatS3mg123_0810 [Burkholderiales bacterium]
MAVELAVKDGGPPAALVLKVIHPTRAGFDQTLRLAPAGKGEFRGALSPPAPGRWVLSLEDDGGTWRLTGSLLVSRATGGAARAAARLILIEGARTTCLRHWNCCSTPISAA